MFKSQPNNEIVSADELLPNPNRIAEIATQTGLVQRKSKKFDPFAFLMVCIQSTITASGTLEQLASALGKTTRDAMSRSAIFQRFHATTVRFFVCIFYETLAKKIGIDQQLEDHRIFDRILVEDSTQYKINAKNSGDFPGHGNGSGETAGCKVDFTYDLLSKEMIEVSLHGATEQDKEIGKQLLAMIKPNDLMLRDMGYFIISEFSEIENKQAYWLSRLPATVNVYIQRNRKQIKLEKILRESTSDSLNLTASMGEAERKKVRLIAVRVDDKTLAKRRRERQQRDLKAKKKSTQDMKTRDEWHIMVTNIKSEKMGLEELCSLYRLRWQIELSFKAWKQSGSVEISLSRKSNPYYLESMILASMIRFVLSFRLYSYLDGMNRLSMDKLFKRFSEWLKKLSSFKELNEIASFHEDKRHIQRDLRRRDSLDDIMNQLFTPSLA